MAATVVLAILLGVAVIAALRYVLHHPMCNAGGACSGCAMAGKCEKKKE